MAQELEDQLSEDEEVEVYAYNEDGGGEIIAFEPDEWDDSQLTGTELMAAGFETIDNIVTVGEKMWKIVDNNATVSGMENKVVHAIPPNTDLFSDFTGWVGPNWHRRRYTSVARSIHSLGRQRTSTDMFVKVHWAPFGCWAKGPQANRGRFLSNCRVTIEDASFNMTNVDVSVMFDDAQRFYSAKHPVAQLGLHVVIDEKPRGAGALRTTFSWTLFGTGYSRQT